LKCQAERSSFFWIHRQFLFPPPLPLLNSFLAKPSNPLPPPFVQLRKWRAGDYRELSLKLSQPFPGPFPSRAKEIFIRILISFLFSSLCCFFSSLPILKFLWAPDRPSSLFFNLFLESDLMDFYIVSFFFLMSIVPVPCPPSFVALLRSRRVLFSAVLLRIESAELNEERPHSPPFVPFLSDTSFCLSFSSLFSRDLWEWAVFITFGLIYWFAEDLIRGFFSFPKLERELFPSPFSSAVSVGLLYPLAGACYVSVPLPYRGRFHFFFLSSSHDLQSLSSQLSSPFPFP